MEENLLSIPDQVIDQLRCSQCKGHLSCGPVRLLPDGTSICGQCSPSNSDIVVYRELLLEEAILKNVTFPCTHKTKGCGVNVAFGQAAEHESKCAYQSYHCPLPVSDDGPLPVSDCLLPVSDNGPLLVSDDETCCWNGSPSELLGHLTKNHSSCLLEAASLTIHIDDNNQGIFAVLKGDFVLFVTYMYIASIRTFNYDVRYFSVGGTISASYKINIENDETPDCSVSLKQQPCPIFDSSFDRINNIIDLSKYIDYCLDNPNSIKINIILNSESSDKLALDTVKNNLTVDYEKLALLLCQKCHKEYLVLPIFKLNEQTVCSECSPADYNPDTSDVKLLQLIAETNFPCRWQSCNFIGTGATIRAHEIHCQFRDYSCPECSALITATFAARHFLSHGTKVVSGCRRVIPSPKYFFLVENNKIIIVKFQVADYTFVGELLLGTFKDEKVIVQFNCKKCARRGLTEFILSKTTPRIDYFAHKPCHKERNCIRVTLRHYE